MASSASKKSGNSVKFAERTTSGRVVSLSRDEEQDIPGDSTSQNDHMNYTVMMPPTPDNDLGDNPDGPSPYGSKPRLRAESQQARHGVSFKGQDGAQRGNAMLSTKNNSKSMLLRTQTNDFDHNRWLFESKGKYGMGNAFWQQDDSYENDTGVSMEDFMDRPWKPLTRKVKISGGVLSPYRVLICVRLVVTCFFMGWRIQNPNNDALWLWALSIVCEVWFSISWLLDVLPKFNPINRSADLVELKEKFETPSAANPKGRSDLPGIDVFITTVDPEKEPPLVTANSILSILAIDYPVEKLSLYISDDGGAMLTFEAMAETVNFAEVWVPFCRKHNIEPRNPDSYFSKKLDPKKHKNQPDFVKDRRWIKREYDEFKVKVNGLSDVIERRCKKYNNKENMKSPSKEKNQGEPAENMAVSKATWMADGTHWPGVWHTTADDHKKGDHPGIVQIMSKVPEMEPVMGHADAKKLDFTGVDIRVPMFAYVSREKRPGYEHNKKAGAMNALVRASAILSNGAFILNVDCDHYVYNSMAVKEGICYMMDRGGDRVCYVQFPQRFEGVDPSDRYASHNTVFFDGNMRALDGLQGPVYVGTGCLFRRYALYGFEPPRINEYKGTFGQKKITSQRITIQPGVDDETHPLTEHPDLVVPQKFGNSTMFNESIEAAEFQGRPLADHFSVKNGRPPGSLVGPRHPLDAPTVAEAIAVISCWYEEKTEWGDRVGWIYGSVTDDVVTGYRMHNRGWRSVYCVTKRDAFRGSAPINLTDRLHQVFIWATGSVEIFFSKNNAFLATTRLKFLQRIAYINLGIYPFTSIFLVVYLFLPALCLFSGQFIVESMDIWFLSFLLLMTILTMLISLLEVRWSGIHLEEFWRNEQFWAIGGSSAHLAAVIRGMLKVIAGIEISFTVTSKIADEDDDEDDIYADLYVVKWTSLFIVPLTIIIVNVIALVIGISRTIYSVIPEWNKLFCSCLFSFGVLAHMYPFAKGLLGKRGRVPTIVYVWAGLVSITVSLLWVTLTRPDSVAMPGSDD